MEGFHEFAFGNDIVQDCIRLKLTQALGRLNLEFIVNYPIHLWLCEMELIIMII